MGSKDERARKEAWSPSGRTMESLGTNKRIFILLMGHRLFNICDPRDPNSIGESRRLLLHQIMGNFWFKGPRTLNNTDGIKAGSGEAHEQFWSSKWHNPTQIFGRQFCSRCNMDWRCNRMQVEGQGALGVAKEGSHLACWESWTRHDDRRMMFKMDGDISD